MTRMPSRSELQPISTAALLGPVLYSFDEPCLLLLGWKQREGVLRMLSTSRAVVGGVVGLRPGDCCRLVLHRGQSLVREARVVGVSLDGIELEHFGIGELAEMAAA